MKIIDSLIVALIAIAPACERNKTTPTTPKPVPVEARNTTPAGNLDERRNQIDDQVPDGVTPNEPPPPTPIPEPIPEPYPSTGTTDASPSP